ncbi:hypothetical protein B0H10DRAFT_2196235 [Mycena sp. CBHHK59/15]|nr:hypothetical protein B0H10DRAFT_2196235 [Mycena sp. CBHHK59/15]
MAQGQPYGASDQTLRRSCGKMHSHSLLALWNCCMEWACDWGTGLTATIDNAARRPVTGMQFDSLLRVLPSCLRDVVRSELSVPGSHAICTMAPLSPVCCARHFLSTPNAEDGVVLGEPRISSILLALTLTLTFATSTAYYPERRPHHLPYHSIAPDGSLENPGVGA